ncbi:aminoacyltransferase [Staphylococcus coagulans]|uniref:aminoacyltransferase n=1 Tax=Staphylococcus coagulans TaxID=74706 RepID=UPI001BE62AE6|nr:aminoacyltransferase [Staphylococcus coagulans]MBT2813188.1 aminoacyltransferase [Staphylococcus coagulans]MBT2815452.1 aminoacyltransferase [Staphylococcus coagulans]MBT2837160.1 aminoacyltransferase [Staphylococcus coagulans]MBT2841688.1 aminoacyltransferase [Staphylococcus coagulans]MBT2847475.1 aminoacyltransferase [Staphylococcus coagulans]
MQFLNLTEQEFDSFTQENFSHYTQSKDLFEYRDNKSQDVHIVGVKNDKGKVIAGCLFTEARVIKFFKYFYSHRGPVMDFHNTELVTFFFENLTQYLKKQNCLFTLVDPYMVINKYNADGEIIASHHYETFKTTLEGLGYQHQGYSIGYHPLSQIRWLSVLDLKDKTEADLLKAMQYQTRRNIKKTEEMHVQVEELSIDETERFFKLFKMAEEKHGFSFRDLDYFKEMQKIYKNSALKIATINLKDYLSTLTTQQQSITETLTLAEEKLEENPNSKKQKSKVQDLRQRLQSSNKKIERIQSLIESDGEVLDLAAALYIYNNHEMYYLSSGSNPKYNEFMGAYKLQWEMIKFSLDHHIDRYNFYGVTGDFSKDAEDYGVQQFKKGFNAHVEEYIGDFVKPIKKNWYFIYKLLNRDR